jgi:hypothetical protein
MDMATYQPPAATSIAAVIRMHKRYHGVPISRKHIKLLRAGVRRSQLPVE